MSEKEIKNDEVAGKKLEDLTEEELKELQGQGDTDGETITTLFNHIPNTNKMTITVGCGCNFRK
ncbi:mersacidin family lantibiotic [Enterococcus sp. LJL99]